MAADIHVWFYERMTVLGEEQDVGPLDQQELVRLAREGKLKRETKVRSPTRTADRWYELNKIPGLLKALEDGEKERAEAQRQRTEAKAKVEQLRQEEREAQKQALVLRKTTESEHAAMISDGQDPAMVLTIAERVRSILISSESLRFIVIQERPLINISPDAVAITNRRLIFYRPKLLGRFTFEDYILFDLYDAHLKQGFLTSTFSAKHTSGRFLMMDWLPKGPALKLYRIAQEMEEQARRARIQLDIELRRAGASNINVSTAPPAPPPEPIIDATVVSSSTPASETMQRLKTLKEMLDGGLISQADFDERKKQILAEL
jgi:hypothetical protein